MKIAEGQTLNNAFRLANNFFELSPALEYRKRANEEARKTIEDITNGTNHAVWRVYGYLKGNEVVLSTKNSLGEIRFLLKLTKAGTQKVLTANRLEGGRRRKITEPQEEPVEEQTPEKPKNLLKFKDLVEELLDWIKISEEDRETARKVFMKEVENKAGDWYWKRLSKLKGGNYYFCRYSEKGGPTGRYLISTQTYKKSWKTLTLKKGNRIPKKFLKENIRIIGEQVIFMRDAVKLIILQSSNIKFDPDSDSDPDSDPDSDSE